MALHKPLRQRTASVSRRRFVAGCGSVVIAGVAGCTSIVNRLADMALGEVNVFNQSDRTVSGTITITDSAGQTVLSESFELASSSDDEAEDDETDDDGHTAYDDVWGGSGTYEASVELDKAVQNQRTASSPVSIENPDEEMLAVTIGAEESDDVFEFRVGEELSELAEQ